MHPQESSHTAYAGEGTSSTGTVQDSVASRKRKSGPGAQEQVKSQLLQLAEMEHYRKITLLSVQQQHAEDEHAMQMKILKVKMEIAELKKKKLTRELANDSRPDSRIPRVSVTSSVTMPHLGPDNVELGHHLWQPYGSR